MTTSLAPAFATATLHLVDTPFLAKSRRTVRVKPGTSIAQALSDHWPEHWQDDLLLDVSCNGHAVEDLWTVVEPGQVWSVMPKHGDPITLGTAVAGFLTGTVGLGAAVATVSAIVITAGIYYGASKLLAPSTPSIDQPDGGGSSTYRWEGVRTDYAPLGGPVPVVYGERIVGGRVIAYFIRSKRGTGGGLRGELWMAFGLSEGPIAGIGGVERELTNATGNDIPESIWVAGTRLRDVPGARISTRFGTNTQSAVPGFNDQVLQRPVGLQLVRGTTLTYQTRQPVSAVEFGVRFPKGLMKIDQTSGGAIYSEPIEFRWRFRETGTTDWSEWDTFRIRERQPGDFTKNVDRELPGVANYQIEIERLTAPQRGQTTPDKSELEYVNEVLARDFRYIGTAAAFVVLTANSVVSGGRPQFEFLVKGRLVRVWDGVSATDPSFDLTWTRSPFWIAYDILTNTDYSIGDELRHATFALDDWEEGDTDAAGLVFADVETTVGASSAAGQAFVYVLSVEGFAEGDQVYLDKGNAGEELITIAEIPPAGPRRLRAVSALTNTHAVGVTVELYHARYEADCVYDQVQSPWEAANEVLSTARAQIAKLGNLVHLVLGKTKPSVLLLTEGNIDAEEGLEVTRLMARNQQPNQLVMQFPNRENRFEFEPLPVDAEDANLAQGDDADYWTREAFRPKDEAVRMITRPAQIRRHGRYRLRAMRLPKWKARGVTSLQALQATLGNVINVAHPTMLAVTSGQVDEAVSSGGSTIKLDRQVTIAGGTTYEVRVRVGDDAWETKTITTTAGTYAAGTALTISGTWGDDVAKGAPYVFGVQDEIVIPMEITNFVRRTDLKIAWEAIHHVESVYADA